MLEAVLHWVGFGLCHQLPERSLFAGGYQLPVCARDTGLYAGFLLSLIVIALVERGRRPSELSRPWLLVIGAIFLGTMVADGVSSYAGWRLTTNDLRLVTGLLAGYSLPLIVIPILNAQMWKTVSGRRLLDGWRAAVWLISAPAAFAVLRWVLPLSGVAYPLLLVFAIVVTFVVVNMIFATLVPAFEHKSSVLRDAWLPMTLSIALVAAELLAASWVRLVVERLAAGL
jgi:uncharacterized membrane protein